MPPGLGYDPFSREALMAAAQQQGMLPMPQLPGAPQAPGLLPQMPPWPIFNAPPPTSTGGSSLRDRVDRLLGVPGGGLLSDAERADMRRATIQGLGTSLLQLSGPQAVQPGFLSNLGAALERSRGMAMNDREFQEMLAQRQAAQQQAAQRAQAFQAGDFDSVLSALVQTGNIDEAQKLSQVLKNTRGEAGARLQFEKLDNGTLVALDPFTGEVVNRIGIETPQGLAILSKDQFGVVDKVRDDFVRDTRFQVDQGQSAGRILTAAEDLQAAVTAGNRSAASASALAMVQAYARLNDPGSVVRSEELRVLFQRLGSAPDKLENWVSQLLSGTMSTDVLNSIVRSMAHTVKDAEEVYDAQLAAAQARLEDSGIAPDKLRSADLFGKFRDLINDPTRPVIVEPPRPPRASDVRRATSEINRLRP